MAAYRVTDAQLTALANTIRSKGGTNEALQFPGGFLQAIRAISGGGAGGEAGGARAVESAEALGGPGAGERPGGGGVGGDGGGVGGG